MPFGYGGEREGRGGGFQVSLLNNIQSIRVLATELPEEPEKRHHIRVNSCTGDHKEQA